MPTTIYYYIIGQITSNFSSRTRGDQNIIQQNASSQSQAEAGRVHSRFGFFGRISTVTVPRIAAACPRLESLEFHRLLDPATISDLTSLLPLTSCTRLALGGHRVGSAAAPIIAQLTQLRELTWSCAEDGELDANGLAQLTRLSQLQQLECATHDCDA